MADQMPDAPYGKPYFEEIRADNLHPESNIGAPGSSLGTLGEVSKSASGAMQSTDHLVVLGGAVIPRPAATGTIPSDFIVNGNVYVAPASYISNPASLPAGLSVDADTGIVLTDGSVFFPDTLNNIGVLCAASE